MANSFFLFNRMLVKEPFKLRSLKAILKMMKLKRLSSALRRFGLLDFRLSGISVG